jgi:hypothetical protein
MRRDETKLFKFGGRANEAALVEPGKSSHEMRLLLRNYREFLHDGLVVVGAKLTAGAICEPKAYASPHLTTICRQYRAHRCQNTYVSFQP